MVDNAMAIRSFIRIPSPGPTLHPPHQKSAERMLKFPASFPCHDDGPVLQSSSHSSSSSPSTVLFPRRTFLSVGLGLLVGSQFQDAEASVEDDPVGLVNGQLQSCDGGTPCVSTSAFRSPSRFMPPWSYLNSKESAFADLVKTLQRMGAKIVETDDDRYVYATLRSSSGENDVDDLEFLEIRFVSGVDQGKASLIHLSAGGPAASMVPGTGSVWRPYGMNWAGSLWRQMKRRFGCPSCFTDGSSPYNKQDTC